MIHQTCLMIRRLWVLQRSHRQGLRCLVVTYCSGTAISSQDLVGAGHGNWEQPCLNRRQSHGDEKGISTCDPASQLSRPPKSMMKKCLSEKNSTSWTTGPGSDQWGWQWPVPRQVRLVCTRKVLERPFGCKAQRGLGRAKGRFSGSDPLGALKNISGKPAISMRLITPECLSDRKSW